MIVLPDVNFLVSACHARHEFHGLAYRMLVEDGGRSVHVALLTEAVSGFVRVMALPMHGSVPPSESIRFIRLLGDGRRGSFTRPDHRQFVFFLDFMERPGVHPKDATDAMLAAGAVALDATLLTLDFGFSRFPGLRWLKPGDRQAVVNPR
jgi:predicted nucleic acid-binding protein